MKRKAFTLVELMVVISIIAILMAAILPTFGKVKTVVRTMRCQSNLHHITNGFADNKAANKAGINTLINNFDPNLWPAQIPGPQIANSELFVCPEDSTPTVDTVDYGTWQDPNVPKPTPAPSPYLPGGYTGSPPVGTGLCFYSQEGIYTPFIPSQHCVAVPGAEGGRTYTDYYIEDSMERLATMPGCKNDGIWRVYDALPGGSPQLVILYGTCSWQNSIWLNGQRVFQGPVGTNGVNLKLDVQAYPSLGKGALQAWNNGGYAAHDQMLNGGMLLAPMFTSYAINDYVSPSHGGLPVTADLILLSDYDCITTMDKIMKVGLSTARPAILAGLKNASIRHSQTVNVLKANGAVMNYGPNQIDPTVSTNLNLYWKLSWQ